MPKQGTWKGGIWYPAKVNNNPVGFNQHKKDNRITIGATEDEKKAEAKELYRKLWKLANERKSIAQRYSILIKEILDIKKGDLE